MTNLPATNDVHREFCRLALNFTNTRHVAVWYPDNTLEVWDLANRKPSWDGFAMKYNVADFETQYGLTPPHDAEQTVAPKPPTGAF
jgi:hypothetical protein